MLVMEWIAGLSKHEHKLDFVERSEGPGKPTRYVPVSRIPSSDPPRKLPQNGDRASRQERESRQAPGMDGNGWVRSRKQWPPR